MSLPRAMGPSSSYDERDRLQQLDRSGAWSVAFRMSLLALPLVEQDVKSGVDLPISEVRPLGVRGADPVPSVLSHDLDPIDRGNLPQVVTHRLEHEVF
jgi:hypothetical protein